MANGDVAMTFTLAGYSPTGSQVVIGQVPIQPGGVAPGAGYAVGAPQPQSEPAPSTTSTGVFPGRPTT